MMHKQIKYKILCTVKKKILLFYAIKIPTKMFQIPVANTGNNGAYIL